MREILFRGKNARTNKWYFGFLGKDIYHGEEYYKIYEVNDIYDDGLHIKDNLINCGDVIPETVGQYTGLKDKNGTKIFEGDIVKIYTKNPTIAQVVFSVENGFLFEIIKYIDKSMIGERVKRTDFRCNIVDFYDKGIEVIGNIYDNPELLEFGGDSN